MRRLGRALRRLGIALFCAVLLLASPVLYVETMCQGTATPEPAAPLSAETRPEVRTLLTYPEWHIVHAYDDYAEVIRTGAPHDFGWLASVTGYWRALCTLTEESAALGEIDGGTKQLVYVIGVSFTAEMLMKGAYEETLGRLAVALRGEERAALDDLSARQAADYARFLRQVPWYLYDFRADAAELDAAATDGLRDRERALALGLEHRARAAYAEVIEGAVAATGQDDLTLQMVVTGLDRARLEQTEGVTVLRPLAGGFEVETPRYRALTHLLADWAAEGAAFLDMAGNDRILFTATGPGSLDLNALAALPRQGYGDRRYLFLVPVAELAERLRGLEAEGLRLEHVHDY